MRYRELLAAVWWLVALPALVYLMLEHTFSVRSASQHSLALVLGTAAFGLYVVRCAGR